MSDTIDPAMPRADGFIDHVPDFPSADQLSMEPKPELLHNAERAVSGVLKTQEQTIHDHGWNGALVARLTLPVESEEQVAKIIGIVDFGEITGGNAPPMFMLDAKPLNLFGKAQSRFGLVGLNYTSSDHLRTYFPLEEGDTTIGRVDNNLSRALGLNPTERGNQATSRQQATITLTTDNGITVKDHSKFGTGFETG